MTPHEREQLLELAERIVLNLRSRLAGIVKPDSPASDLDAAAFRERLRPENDAPDLNEKDKPHDQI